MHLVYIDDSKDEKLCVFSALTLAADQWRKCFASVRMFRRRLKESDGIFIHKEFHAWKFVSGRGQIADRVVTKFRRCSIFADLLDLTATLPGARLFNAVFPLNEESIAFERLLNRINRTMQAWDSRAILICDQGKETEYTRMVRRMGVYNPIPSNQGVWTDTGTNTRNIPIDRVIEDPFFKDSSKSYFIQLADFSAYSLLRRERPVATKSKYGLDKAFARLGPILVREATRYDPEGVLRPKK